MKFLESILTKIRNGLQGVMPWVFLAFRRALIPTVIALAGPLVFLIVGQGTDLLYGLSEPRLVSSRKDSWLPFHVPGVTAYFVTAFGYALSVWYSARLLSTVEPQGLPPSLTDEEYELPTRWYPRILGSVTLLLAYAALLKAWSGCATGWVLLSVAGAMAVANYILTPQWRNGWRGRVLLSLSALGLGSLCYCLVAVQKLGLVLVLLLTATVPGIFLWLVVKRREWFRAEQKNATQKQEFGAVLARLATWLCVCGLLMLGIGFAPAPFLRACGSAATAFVFLAGVSLAFTVFHLIVRYCADGVPGLSACVALLSSILVYAFGSEGLGHEHLELKSATPSSGVPLAVERTAQVYVSTYGGGIRAAAFTAQVLAEADDQSCGWFGEHVEAMSGVSGGSVGIAVYLTARQEGVVRGIWQDCVPDQAPSEKTRPLTGLVKDALVQDHLAPVIGRMLAVDAPHLPWVSPARGKALLESVHHALLAAYNRKWGDHDYPGLALRLGELTGGRTPPIRAYFNAADADTGQITWFSNVNNGSAQVQGQDLQTNLKDLAVGQPMLHSARFPLISPAGAFGRHRLVDGGYIDNSGADTLSSVGQMDPTVGSDTRCWIVLDGNQEEEVDATRVDVAHPPLLTPLQALLQARSGNALRAVNALKGSKRLAPHVQRLEVPKGEPAPALGWYLSAAAADTLERSSRESAGQLLTALRSGTPQCPASTSETKNALRPAR